MADSNTCEGTRSGIRRIGFLLGPALALGMLVAGPPAGLSAEAWAAAAVATLMAVWWVTEALPLAATALALWCCVRC